MDESQQGSILPRVRKGDRKRMKWSECSVTKDTANLIRTRGGKPLKMFLYEHRHDRMVVIVSSDPSGPGGQFELHASVSASTQGKRRRPTDVEVHRVGERVGMKVWQTTESTDGLVRHLWSELAVQT